MNIILGTAGHIDHGKSSLVKHLTGSDPDRLPEEKARGVTIDLGFAHLTLSDETTSYELGIVDVPGHADFVNNMVAGVGALDIAIFIIAADDGWMPQSEEHLHILNYLGISNVIIALTKCDLCDDVPFSVELLRDELQDTTLAEAPIIPVSSHTGEGMDDLKQALLKTVRKLPKKPLNEGKPRLAIDRLFSPKGTGTVVTGTLTGGNIQLGETLTLHPMELQAKVRYIQNHNQPLETAVAGMRTALNLPDLPLGSPGKPGAERGQILAHPDLGPISHTLDVQLNRLARPIPGHKPKILRHTETVILHHGSARCKARVILHDRTTLNPGESCLAQLRLEQPHLFLTGDRFVIRDGGQQLTLAGGVVLDPLADRLGFRTPERAEFLTPRAEQPLDILTDVRTRLQRDHQLSPELPNTPYSTAEIKKTLTKLTNQGVVVPMGGNLLEADWWKGLLDTAAKAIVAWHEQHPDIPAMPIDDLRHVLSDCPADLFDKIPDTLTEKGFSRQNNGISSQDHQLTLPDEIAPQADAILRKLDAASLNPPNKADLTPAAKDQQAMQFLIRSGQVIELDPKLVISRKATQLAAEKVSSFLTEHGQGTASELRQHLDTSRKIAMPLLEYLDSTGLTIRQENFRKLR